MVSTSPHQRAPTERPTAQKRELPSLVGLGLLVWVVMLGTGLTAHATDDDVCLGISSRQALQLALQHECPEITLADEFPSITRPITLQRDVTLIMDDWSIPPLDVATGVHVTVVGGRADPKRALRRENALFPSIIDVSIDAHLTMTDTVIVQTDPQTSDPPHAVVRQAAGSGSGAVVMNGTQTETVLDHIVLLQHSSTAAQEPCTLTANAYFDASAAGPMELALTSGGVLSAALCTSDGIPVTDFASTSDSGLWLSRVSLTGEMSGLESTHSAVPIFFPPVFSPNPVFVTESLLTRATGTSEPIVASADLITATTLVGAAIDVGSGSLLSAPRVALDNSLLCTVSGSGAVIDLGSFDSSEANVQRTTLDGAEVMLISGPTQGIAAVKNVTARRFTDGQLVSSALFPVLENTYTEGPWVLPDLSDSQGDVVQALLVVGTACPADVAACTELSESSLQDGAFDCDETLDEFFSRHDGLANWPSKMGEITRLVDRSECSDLLLGVHTEDTERWGCEPDIAPRVGAWPGETCGLPLFAHDTAQTPECLSEEEDSTPASSERTIIYGCQAKGVHAVAIFCLAPLALRRRPRSQDNTRQRQEP